MKKTRYQRVDDTSDYTKGYLDGQRAAFEESELDAYYAGVGYGKKNAGDKHIGFNNDEERRQFEKGISNKDKHFRAYQAEPLTLWDRLFGLRFSPDKMVHTKGNARDRVNRTRKGRNKIKKQRARTRKKILNLPKKFKARRGVYGTDRQLSSVRELMASGRKGSDKNRKR